LQDLVAIPSVSGDEAEIAGYVAHESRKLGHTVIRLNNNVVVYIPGQDSSRAFLMNGHLDTVPPNDEWTTDPFVLTPDPDNENIYEALGAADMKPGDATMLAMSAMYAERRPPCDTFMVYTDREEVAGSGAQAVAEWLSERVKDRYRAIGGVILEPTDASFVGEAIQGDTNWHVFAKGLGGHAFRGYENPAIERMGRLVADLGDIRDELKVQTYIDPILGSPNINVTEISGGTASNVVPTEAVAVLNLRVTRPMLPHLEKLRTRLEKRYGVSIVQEWEPSPTVCDSRSAIYRAAKSALGDMEFTVYPGATDQCFFVKNGIPMLMYGPGEVGYMHVAGERVDFRKVVFCREKVLALHRAFATQDLAA